MIALAMLWLMSCLNAPDRPAAPSETSARPAESTRASRGEQGPPPAPGRPGSKALNYDHGQKNPPIPANLPAWNQSVHGFVPNAGWYGEHDWADVRMRVAGHLATAGRDLARVEAMQGDLAAAAAAYADLARRLDAIPAPPAGTPAARILALQQAAAHRDADLTAALANGRPPPVPKEGLAALRARYLGLAQRKGAGHDVASEARALQADLTPFLRLREDLALDAWADFDARHALRVRLWQAALDAVDPLGFDEPWGYWTADEVPRAALAIGIAAGRLGGEDWSDRAKVALADRTWSADPTFWPTRLVQVLPGPNRKPGFTVEGLGRLPTGDTLIDTAGEPGPLAIGRLEKLGLDDPKHRAWLEARRDEFNELLASNPKALLVAVDRAVAHLDSYPYGSRYYNIKQLRNAAVRQLARAGHPDLAVKILRENFPLHDQDWYCPNRAGILHAIEGRLLAEAGDLEGARAALERSLNEAQSFLASVAKAEMNASHPPLPEQSDPPPAKADPRWPGAPRPLRPAKAAPGARL